MIKKQQKFLLHTHTNSANELQVRHNAQHIDAEDNQGQTDPLCYIDTSFIIFKATFSHNGSNSSSSIFTKNTSPKVKVVLLSTLLVDHLTLNTSNPCPLQAKMNLVLKGRKMPCTTTKTLRNSWMNSHKSISYHTSTQQLCLHVYLPGFDTLRLSACLNLDSQPKVHSIKHHMAQSF